MVVDVAHRHKSACYDSPPLTCIGAMEGCAEQRLSGPETPKLLGTSAHFFKEKSYPKHAKPQVRAIFSTLQIRTANPFQETSDPYGTVGAITGGGRGARLGVPPCLWCAFMQVVACFWCRFGVVQRVNCAVFGVCEGARGGGCLCWSGRLLP